MEVLYYEKNKSVIFISAARSFNRIYEFLYKRSFNDYTDLNNLSDGKRKYEVVVVNDGCLYDEEIKRANDLLGSEINKIIYTSKIEKSELKTLIHGEARGIVSKKTGIEKLREAMITVNNGGKYYCENVIEMITKEEGNKIETLTKRQKEIYNLTEAGIQNKQIADMLCISVKTVEVHKQNIKIKLGRNDIIEILC